MTSIVDNISAIDFLLPCCANKKASLYKAVYSIIGATRILWKA